MLDALKNFIRWLIEEVKAPDPPRGSLVILRQREVMAFHPHHSPYGVPRMHVEVDVAIPLLTDHEKAQKVSTRNFLAIQNGNEADPIATIIGADALTMTSVTVGSATKPVQYGDKLELKLYNVDQAGNVSTTPLDGAFVVTDTTPPDAPVGAFTVTAREVADDVATNPDPAPAPEPTPTPPVEEDAEPSSPPSG